MRVHIGAILLAAFILASCGNRPSATPTPAPDPTSDFPAPPVAGPDPSDNVAAFYYPWYGTPEYDRVWVHWTQNGHQPPQDIASDFYPAIGPYSSNDPGVVAQHMAWLRKAGIGVIIISWWGRGSAEEQPIPLILKAAERYGIKVAFHIEPYHTRTADGLVEDVKYLYAQYGNSPAFFRSTASPHYSPGSQPKGVFFVWCIESPGDCGQQKVQASYWQKAVDEIHALPQGALVIANTTDGSWVNGGHFDGLYNYATLHLDPGGFSWAHTIPPGSLYVPSVIPGLSARRVGYPENTYVPRDNGQTYDYQWTAALHAGVRPFMVTITSFNEWHEGTMIEPPASGKVNGHGYTYGDFGTMPADGYLTLTRQWVDKLSSTVSLPSTSRVRIQIKTTSDWTTLSALQGGYWLQPALVSASGTATRSGFESGDRFILSQSLDDATKGFAVEMTWDVQVAGLAPGGGLSLQIDRGNIGSTEVTVYNYTGSDPVPVGVFTWSTVTSGRNTDVVTVPSDKLLNPAP